MRGLGPAHRHHHHLLTRLSAAKGGFAVTELVETAEERHTEPLRVLLVDDHDLFRTGLRNLLDNAILAHTDIDVGRACRKVDEIPFDFSRRRMSVIIDTPAGVTCTRKRNAIGSTTKYANAQPV